MHAADAALYAAKRAGRNTVRLAAAAADVLTQPEAPHEERRRARQAPSWRHPPLG